MPFGDYHAEKSSYISGIGNYNLEKKLFNGALEIDNGIFTNAQKKSRFQFSKGVISKTDYNAETKLLEFSDSVFKNVAFVSENLKAEAGGLTLSSLQINNNDIIVGEASLPETQVTLNKNISEVTAPLFKTRKGKFSLEKLEVDGKIHLLNAKKEKQIVAESFDLTLTSPASAKAGENMLKLKAQLDNGAVISATGNFSLFPIKTSIESQFENVSSATLSRYYKKIQKLKLTGSIAGKISFQYPEKIYAGNISLNEGSIGGGENKFSLGWQKAQLNGFTIADLPYRIGIDSLTLERPQVILESHHEHFLTSIKKGLIPLLAVDLPEGETTINPQLTINKAVLRNGVVSYTDGRLSPPWQVDISSFEGTFNNYRIKPSLKPIDFALKGNIADSTFSYEGRFINAPEGPQETFSLQQSLVPLSLYKEQLGNAFAIETRDTLIDLKYQKSERTTPAIASFDISLAQAKPRAATTDLSLALLENKKKKISATLLFQSSEKHLLTNLENHFQKLLIKSSVSPYLLLDPPHNNLRNADTFTFSPGRIALNGDIKKQLDGFADLVKDHPRVKLLLQASISPYREKAALQKTLEAIEQDRVKQKNAQQLAEWQTKQTEQSSDTSSPPADSSTDEITEEELELFTPASPQPVVITNEKLRKLAKIRLKAMQDYLVKNLSIPTQNVEIENQVELSDKLSSSIVTITLGAISNQLE